MQNFPCCLNAPSLKSVNKEVYVLPAEFEIDISSRSYVLQLSLFVDKFVNWRL